jgi:hypothetical protein
MLIPHEDITAPIDRLIEGTQELERRLEASGVAAAHDWMFAIREALYDLRRAELALAGAIASSDEEAASQVHRFVQMMLHEVLPHIHSHFDEIQPSIDAVAGMDDEDVPD